MHTAAATVAAMLGRFVDSLRRQIEQGPPTDARSESRRWMRPGSARRSADEIVIADPNDGPRTCSLCEHLGACQSPEACELAEQERIAGLAARRHRRRAAARGGAAGGALHVEDD